MKKINEKKKKRTVIVNNPKESNQNRQARELEDYLKDVDGDVIDGLIKESKDSYRSYLDGV